jgi:cytochrome c peroxidase
MFRDSLHRRLESQRLREVASNSSLRRAVAVLAAALLVAPLSGAQQRNVGAGNVGNTANAGGRVGGGAAPNSTSRATKIPGALSATNVPLPSNLMDFVSDFDAAVRLGKAFFWDVQVGSDSMTSCATCHWHAGADVRAKSQLAPGHDGAYHALPTGPGGVNYEVKSGDFPFNERADPNDHDSPLVRDINDRLTSSGIQHRLFTGVTPGVGQEDGIVVQDPPFNLNGSNVGRVEPRNSPTVINAIFNVRSFWDGRAQEKFNGVNIWGDLDPNARVLEKDASGNLVWTSVLLDKAALASQAVGPALSDFEMSYAGKSMPDLGRKMVSAMPLRDQFIDPTDVHLGQFSAYPLRGMSAGTTYADLIEAAFHDRWHGGSGAANGYSHMEQNFSLYWGIAILCYESQLVSNQTPFDRYAAGDASAMTPEQIEGMKIYNSGGAACAACHSGSEFAGATWSQVAEHGAVEHMATVGSQAFDELAFTTFPDFSLNVLSFDPRGGQIQILTPGGAVVAFGNIPGSSQNCVDEEVEVNLQAGPAAPIIPGADQLDLAFEAEITVESLGQQLPSGLCYVNMTVGMEWGNNPALPAGLYPVIVNGTQIGALNMGTAQPDGIYDVGYYNLGVRPSFEDIGAGANGPFGPLSISKRLQAGDPTVAQWMPQGGVGANEYAIVNGTFKTPSLRNISLTGPYFHNGGAATLEQVIQFYARGADFAEVNSPDLDEDVDGVGSIRNKPAKQAALVAFLRDALLDPRVATRSGVFCTPSLPLKDGYDGNELFVVDNGLGEAVATINELPQTGATGGPAFRAFADMLAGGVNVVHDPVVRVEEDAMEGCGPLAKISDSERVVRIYLTNQPTDTVTIDLSVTDATELELEPAQLVFTTSDWFHPHEVKVKGLKDGELDGLATATIVTSSTQSADMRYNGIDVADVTVEIVDTTSYDNQIYVDSSFSGQHANGSNASPYRRVSEALACAPEGAVIHVAPGTYHENLLVQGRDVTIEGWGATIDGGRMGPCVTVFGAATHGTVLRGLNLVNGGGQNSQAGALFVTDSSSVLVDGCVLSDSLGQQGGGAYVRNSSHLQVVDAVVERNVGQQQGGGLMVDGGSLSLANTIVWDNATNGDGGGVLVINTAQVAMDGVLILRNSAGQRAGGLFLNGGSANLYNVSVSFNSANQQVGGVLAMNSASVVATGFKVANNSVQNGGVGGMFVDGGVLDLERATLATNSGAQLFLMNSMSVSIRNSIVWGSGNGDAVASNLQSQLPGSIHHSIVDWGGFATQGYLRADPLFVDAAAGNHNVQSGSPAEDGGDPASTDEDGSRSDMGAHQIVGN